MGDLEADFRAAVKDCLTRAQVSQAHVARQLGITPKHLCQMLTGKAPMSIAWAGRIAEVCGRELRITSVRRRGQASHRAGEPGADAPRGGPVDFGEVSDDHGNAWPRCSETCDIHVVRPGFARCQCEPEEYPL